MRSPTRILITGPIRRIGRSTWLSLALSLAVLGSLAVGLSDNVRGLDMWLLLTLIVMGLLIGWGMGVSPLPGWQAGLLVPALGSGVVLLWVGGLWSKLMAVLLALGELARTVWHWFLGGPTPGWMSVALALVELWADMITLLNRGRDWVLAFLTGDSFFDPVAAVLVWCMTVWAVAAWAGWMVRRHNRPLWGVVPAGALLSTTLFYAGASSDVLLLLMGATSLLIVLRKHDARECHWQTTGTDFSPEIRRDLMVWGILLALTLMTVAALAPTFSVRDIADLVRHWTEGETFQTEQITTSLGLMRQPEDTAAFAAVRAGGLPRRHLVGSGSELSRRVMMVVRIDDLSGDLSDALPNASPVRYYWRSITYDRYDGRGWYTGPTQTFEYEAGQQAIAPTGWPAHRVVRQEVEVVGDVGGLLYVAGSLVTADRDFEVAWRASEDVFAASIEAGTYRADSVVPVVSEEQLRSAGTDLAGLEHSGGYLHLPDGIPVRVLALARHLTATEPTAYDRARVIEAYLRTFPYSLDVPLPPPDQDVVDYFIFDLQRGYCDYYATAMVVLARAAGLPARLVVGYFGGTYDAENSRYIVTEADAHAWAEVYLPRYGWVEFEPTAGRPPIERQDELRQIEWPEPEEWLQPAPPESGILYQFGWWSLFGGLALLALASVIWWMADGWRLRLSAPAATAMILYRRLRRDGQRLSVPMEEGDTPYEFATSLGTHVAALAQGRYWTTALTPVVQEVQWLSAFHVLASYAACPPDADDQRRAIRTWRRLHRRLWAAWVRQKIALERSGSAT